MGFMYRALALLTESIWACGPCASLHAHYFAHVHALGKGREAERITSTEEWITSEGHHVFLTRLRERVDRDSFLNLSRVLFGECGQPQETKWHARAICLLRLGVRVVQQSCRPLKHVRLQARACVRAGEQLVVRDFCAWQASVRVADRSMLSALTYLIGIIAAASVVVYAAYTRGHEVLAYLSFSRLLVSERAR